jgi:hypothetical protein
MKLAKILISVAVLATLLVAVALGWLHFDAPRVAPPPKPAVPTMPRDALVNLSLAYQRGDRELFLDSIQVSGSALVQVVTCFDIDLARREFVARFDKEYREFIEPPTLLWIRSPEDAGVACLVENGDVVSVPGAPLAKLVKVGELWKADLTPRPGEMWNTARLAAMREQLDTIRALTGRAGEAGLTARELRKLFLSAIGEAVATTQR